MNTVSLLDCTLRDGAYLLDKKFGDNTIYGLIDGLCKARIDYIEVGFFQDNGFGEGKTVFKNSGDAKRFIPEDKKGCCFTVLADYSRYSVENLDLCTGESIDAVRECFFKKERFDALDACKAIKGKGYKLFVQPVDILGYSDKELIEFIELLNEIEPYCLSIVDTFGSMFQEDLHRIFEIINHNLVPTCKIGFHSHNNMQLSNALSQEFVRMVSGKREGIVDSTLCGMGRGAGNTPTECIAHYMVSQYNYSYDIDALLDVIDTYMDNIKVRCSWGYSIPYFVAGCYSAHVNNVEYLTRKNSIHSKDMRYILNKIGSAARKRYNYDLLEKTYIELLSLDIDDTFALKNLEKNMSNKNVLVLVPGNSAAAETKKIKKYISENDSIVISVNFIHDEIKSDYVYMSNLKRYQYWKNNSLFQKSKKIFTSNLIIENVDESTLVVSFIKLIKCGWESLDNSTLMLLRLLDLFNIKEIAIAGFDGYSYTNDGKLNYVSKFLELSSVAVDPIKLNKEIMEMLDDYVETRQNKKAKLIFVTESRFQHCINGDKQ